MNFSNFFISRPIFATVLAIIVTLVGVMAMRVLPIEQYPSVVPPTVSVQAQFPGADAETVAQTVAAPLAEAINGVEDMLYMTSNSADNGTMSLSVAFNIGTDGDINTINVNNRVQGALSQLPEAVQSQGVTVELRSDSILMLVALTSQSGDYDKIYMQNYATLNILDELRQVPGVGNAEVLGGGEFAMRIWMDPDKLAQYDLTPSEVASAIRAQNTEIPAGNLAATPQSDPRAYTYTITAGGRLTSTDDFREIFLRTNPDGSSLRLQDVARIELGASFYGVDARLNGDAMTPIIINQQPGGQRAGNRRGGACHHGRAGRAIPARARVRHSLRYDAVHRCLGRDGDQDVHRSVSDRHRDPVHLPAELALYRDRHVGGAGVGDRYLRRLLFIRFLDQPADAICPGAVDRHRGG